MGSQKAVEAAVSSHFQGATPLKQNTALIALLERVKPGSTFWMVGDQSLLAQMPDRSRCGGGSAEHAAPGAEGADGHGRARSRW